MKQVLLLCFTLVCTNLFSKGAYQGNYDSDLTPVAVDYKWGYINAQAEMAIEAKFDDARCFAEGVAFVKQDGKWGLIDKSGNFVIKPRFIAVSDFSEKLAAVTEEGSAPEFINHKGEVVLKLPGVDEVYNFSEGLAPVKVKGLWGYVDLHGTTIIKPAFFEARPFYEGAAVVAIQDTDTYTIHYGFIDKKGKYIAAPKYLEAADFHEGMAVVENYVGYGYIDKTGKELIIPGFDMAGNFNEGMAVAKIKTSPMQGIDANGEEAVSYDTSAYTDNVGYYGYIDKSGNWVIPPYFIAASAFNDGNAIVTDSTGYSFLINKAGKQQTISQYNDLVFSNTGSIFYRDYSNGAYGIMNKNGVAFIGKWFQLYLTPALVSVKTDYFDSQTSANKVLALFSGNSFLSIKAATTVGELVHKTFSNRNFVSIACNQLKIDSVFNFDANATVADLVFCADKSVLSYTYSDEGWRYNTAGQIRNIHFSITLSGPAMNKSDQFCALLAQKLTAKLNAKQRSQRLGIYSLSSRYIIENGDVQVILTPEIDEDRSSIIVSIGLGPNGILK